MFNQFDFIKIPFLLITLLNYKICLSQIKTDGKIKNAVVKAINKTKEEIKKSDIDFNDNICIVNLLQIDTLNKKEFKKRKRDKSIKIFDVETDEEVLLNTINYDSEKILMISKTIMSGDSLYFLATFGLLTSVNISFTLFKENLLCYYYETIEGDDKILWKENNHKESFIMLSSHTASITLDKKPQLNDTLYGKLELTTEPFFEYNNNFSNNYIHKKLRIELLFKQKITNIE